MIILDTNVLSALMREVPDQTVLAWMDRQPDSSLWTTTVTLMELRYGLKILPLGRRRQKMTEELEAVLQEEIEGRYADFDIPAAEQAAELMAMRKHRGRLLDFRDTMIAGIALAARATLATRNVAHFEDISIAIVNPWNV